MSCLIQEDHLKIYSFNRILKIPYKINIDKKIKELSSKYEITLFVQKPITFLTEEFQSLPIKIITLGNSSTSDLNFWLNFSSEVRKQTFFLKNQSNNFDLVISSFFPMNVIANELELKHLQFCFQPYAFFWDNELIQSLAARAKEKPTDPELISSAELLLDQARIIEGESVKDPAVFARRMTEVMIKSFSRS